MVHVSSSLTFPTYMVTIVQLVERLIVVQEVTGSNPVSYPDF